MASLTTKLTRSHYWREEIKQNHWFDTEPLFKLCPVSLWFFSLCIYHCFGMLWSHQFCFILGSPLSQCLECLTQTINALNSKVSKISNISEIIKNNEIKTLGKILGSVEDWLWVCQSAGRQDHWGGQVVTDCGWTVILSPKFRPIVWKY